MPGTDHEILRARRLGIRVDSAMEPNATVVPYYDSLIIKLIHSRSGSPRSHGTDASRPWMNSSSGIKTILLHRKILTILTFKGHVSTTFLDRFLAGQSS